MADRGMNGRPGWPVCLRHKIRKRVNSLFDSLMFPFKLFRYLGNDIAASQWASPVWSRVDAQWRHLSRGAESGPTGSKVRASAASLGRLALVVNLARRDDGM